VKIGDRLYGEFVISEPVLQELILSKPVQRLKGVTQHGLPPGHEIFPKFTRYEHSVGVMLLLRKLGASVEEQVAGLLHDVSHTAFSHVFDFVVNDMTENFQDEVHEQIVRKSEIPVILKKYDFDVDKICNIELFSLLEQKTPELCADRVDYGLREMVDWADPENAQFYFDSLTTHDGKIVFSSERAALGFSNAFLRLQNEHWGNPKQVLCYHFLAKAIRTALDNDVISMGDAHVTDDVLLKKLIDSDDEQVQGVLKELATYRFEETDDPDFTCTKKFRYADPLFMIDGLPNRLSEVNQGFKKHLEEQRELNKKGVSVKVYFDDEFD